MNIREHFSLEDLIRRGMPYHEAIDLLRNLGATPGFADEPGQWSYLSRQVLRPHHPASVHEDLFRETYRTWDPRKGPPPAWVPPDDIRSRCNLGRLLDRLGFATEADLRAWSVRDRAGFWAAMVRALGIQFNRPFEAVVDLADGPERPRWFPGAMLNITASCFRADPEAIALRQHTERGDVRELTFGALERLCNRVAEGLASAGVAPGESVGLLLPMTVEAIAVLLGIIRAGCVVVAVAESFAPSEIERRLRLGGARLVMTQDAILRRGGPPATLPQATPGRRGPGRRHPVGRRTGHPAPPGGPVLERLPLPARRVHAGPLRADGACGHPLLLRDHGRPQGDSLVTDDHDQGRRRRLPLPGHPARRRGRLAHQPGLDDGPVAGLRHAPQPRHDRPLRRAPRHRGLLPVRGGGGRHHPGPGPEPGRGLEGTRLAGEPRLEPDQAVQLQRRMLQPWRHALPDGAGRVSAGDRVPAAGPRSAAAISPALCCCRTPPPASTRSPTGSSWRSATSGGGRRTVAKGS